MWLEQIPLTSWRFEPWGISFGSREWRQGTTPEKKLESEVEKRPLEKRERKAEVQRCKARVDAQTVSFVDEFRVNVPRLILLGLTFLFWPLLPTRVD